MSKLIRIPPRERWAAKSAVLTKWLIGRERFPAGSPVCEVSLDGVVREVREPSTFEADWCVYWSFVREGGEIGPSGDILQYHDNLNSSFDPRSRLHTRARRPLERRARYPSIFISYRREDSEPYAWRLHEALANVYGASEVFLDQFSIRPGENWAWTVQQAAVHCEVMIVVIGSRWLSVSDGQGRRRLNDNGDLVLRELCAALDVGAQLCPLLVGDAALPASSDLPDELTPLLDFQFASVLPRSWTADLAPVISEIRRVLEARAT